MAVPLRQGRTLLRRRRRASAYDGPARVTLADGAATTVHVARHDLARTALRVVLLPRPRPLLEWSASTRTPEAIVGGFFVRVTAEALGEVRTGGVRRPSVPFDAPWGGMRACVHSDGGRPEIVRRHELPPAPRGDLLQAGPLLVRDGARAIAPDADVEGFRVAAHQFDSDITDGRHPRAALAIAGDRLLAVASDGRARGEAGLTLTELADLLLGLGAEQAINLDGGGSTSLISGGSLRNHPRELEGAPIPGGRPVVTAIAFDPA
jgi:Phosphodiester glycosidase